MKKEKITFEQLALLSYIKFTVLNGVDVAVLMGMLKDTSLVAFDDSSNDYYVMNDGMIVLEKQFIKKFYENVDKELYESLEGTKALKYLDNMDMLEFVLRKIKLMGIGNVIKDSLTEDFCFLQRLFMDTLEDSGLICEYTHEDDKYENYQAIKLTRRGNLCLFLIEHKEAINNFKNELIELGYDAQFMGTYLLGQDLTIEINRILTIDGYVAFCNEYNLFEENNVDVKKRSLVPNQQ